MNSKQADVYDLVVKPLVREVIEGYNCTVFAYGQTGTGKTFTMEGDRPNSTDEVSWEDDPQVGIIPRSVANLFSELNCLSNSEYSVKISFMELYNEELSDLLSDSSSNEKLRIFDDPARKGSVQIPNLEEVVVQNKSDVYRILQKGADKRQKASTLMNSQSSRSHSIFCITVFIKEKSIDGEETIKVGKLNLVDLAGSENIERSGATGKRAAEAGKINKSLTTLGRVITALVEHRDHIPYRESNLTRLLQDSLGGKTKTSIIATISPALCNFEETLSTLDYAHKAKSIRNKPEVNQKLVKKALIKEYTEEIEKLKRELVATREKNGIFLPPEIHSSMEAKIENQCREICDLNQRLAFLKEEKEKWETMFKDKNNEYEEQSEVLRETSTKLLQTETRLENVWQECQETKHVLGEHVKTESVLYDQADQLQQHKHTAQTESNSLHDKIDRYSKLCSQNRLLTMNLAEETSNSTDQMDHLHKTVEHATNEKLCSIVCTLNDVSNRLTSNQENSSNQIEKFNDEEQEWLQTQADTLSHSLADKLVSMKTNFCQMSSEQQEIHLEHLRTYTRTCQKHRETYFKSFLKCKQVHQSMEQESSATQTQLKKLGNEFVQSNQEQIQLNVHEFKQQLGELNSSMQQTKADMSEMRSLKQTFRFDMSDQFKSIQTLLAQFAQSFEEKFQKLEENFARLEASNEENMNKLSQFQVKLNSIEQTSVQKLSDDFECNVQAPLRAYFETNTSQMEEMNKIAEQLNERDELASAHFQESINSIRTHLDENRMRLEEELTHKCERLEQVCHNVHSDLDKHKGDIQRFLENFAENSVRAEMVEMRSKVDHAIKLTTETKEQQQEFGHELTQFIQQNLSRVSKFAEQDYSEYETSGSTPKRRRVSQRIDLAKTEQHSLLIQQFRENQKGEGLLKPNVKLDSCLSQIDCFAQISFYF